MQVAGYQILRELGASATATTYLAQSSALDRPAVVKVLREELAADTTARARFVNGARLQARCEHPNVVRVLEIGEQGPQIFVACEYLRGGHLAERLQQGLRVRELAGAVADIARALDHVHGQGVVHCDVKPTNILFREDGQAALGDFGIAVEVDGGASLSARGTVVGSAAYMSPEQATGAPLDARTDVYALGALIFEALSGVPPFGHGDAATVAQRQVHDPAPRLPAYLDGFQTMVDRALAKQPGARYPTAGALAQAFGERVGSSDLGTVTLRSDAVDTLEIRAVGGAILAAARLPKNEKDRKTRLRDRADVRTAAALLVLVLFLWWANALVERSETAARVLAIVGLVRDPAVQAAWDNAQSLHRDPNQSLATVVAAYRRVLSIDPRDERAQEALAKLATEWKGSVERALAQGNVTLADNRLSEYLLVFPSDPELAELSQRIADRRTADNLVNNALAQLRSGGIGDPVAATLAIRSYREVLRLVPEHPVAQKELDVLAEHYARLAAEAAAAGDMSAAIDYLDRASTANAGLPLLSTIRAQMLGAETTQAALDALLAEAARHRTAGALIDPPGANAAELYHRVLATDPSNAAAIEGTGEVVDQLIASINEYLHAGDLVSAGELVARASEIGLDQAAVADIRDRFVRELARFNAVVRNLEDAAALFERGLITEPPERNAVLLLREVERLDPGNRSATVLLTRCADRLAEVAQEAHDQGMKNLGRRYLELALSVTPDVEAWVQLREQWRRDD
jgi:Ser/Thr protein kinase RdoA (MazF antagonist)